MYFYSHSLKVTERPAGNFCAVWLSMDRPCRRRNGFTLWTNTSLLRCFLFTITAAVPPLWCLYWYSAQLKLCEWNSTPTASAAGTTADSVSQLHHKAHVSERREADISNTGSERTDLYRSEESEQTLQMTREGEVSTLPCRPWLVLVRWSYWWFETGCCFQRSPHCLCGKEYIQ